MILQTLENNSIVVIGNLVGEFDTVVAFRQFRIAELVKLDDIIWQIVDCDTSVDTITHTMHNYYTLLNDNQPNMRSVVAEIDLLRANPRTTPSNIIDAIAPVLPMPYFVGGSWGRGGFTPYLKNMS